MFILLLVLVKEVCGPVKVILEPQISSKGLLYIPFPEERMVIKTGSR